MKMNWGSWIVVSFIVFAIGTFTMVYISMNSKVDLVSDDYYEKELQYQKHIDLVKATGDLSLDVSMSYHDSSVTFLFPQLGEQSQYSGSLYFFRPSDKRGDVIIPVSVDTKYGQTFNRSNFAKGMWRVKISWNVGEAQYYSELPMMIN